MKKSIIVFAFAVLLICICTISNAANLKMSLVPEKSEIEKGKQLKVNIQIEDFTRAGENKAIEGRIEYESSKLKLDKIEWKNGWTGVSDANTAGRIGMAINKAGTVAAKEVIAEVTFTVTGDAGTAKINVSNITTSSDGDSVEVGNTETTIKVAEVAVDPPATEKKLDSIAISGTPTKSYVEGEKFTSKGIKVTATYTDKTTKDVTSAIAWAPSGELKTTDKEITIMYTENGITKTNTLSIVVSAKKDPDEKDPDEKDPDEKDPEKKPGDGTEADRDLSKAGLEKTILSILIGALGVSSIAGYAIYKKN